MEQRFVTPGALGLPDDNHPAWPGAADALAGYSEGLAAIVAAEGRRAEIQADDRLTVDAQRSDISALQDQALAQVGKHVRAGDDGCAAAIAAIRKAFEPKPVEVPSDPGERSAARLDRLAQLLERSELERERAFEYSRLSKSQVAARARSDLSAAFATGDRERALVVFRTARDTLAGDPRHAADVDELAHAFAAGSVDRELLAAQAEARRMLSKLELELGARRRRIVERVELFTNDRPKIGLAAGDWRRRLSEAGLGDPAIEFSL
ncbi:MAG: hypothetical protein JXR96_26970 [Deltaproteobacteria bacterium]|nr:hypothetical protein [Deltaproteobacteria bacterium]